MDQVSTEQLRRWIRVRECEVMMARAGSREARDAQQMLDHLCRELGRRGED